MDMNEDLFGNGDYGVSVTKIMNKEKDTWLYYQRFESEDKALTYAHFHYDPSTRIECVIWDLKKRKIIHKLERSI